MTRPPNDRTRPDVKGGPGKHHRQDGTGQDTRRDAAGVSADAYMAALIDALAGDWQPLPDTAGEFVTRSLARTWGRGPTLSALRAVVARGDGWPVFADEPIDRTDSVGLLRERVHQVLEDRTAGRRPQWRS